MRGQADWPAGRPAASQSARSGRAGGHPGPARTGTHMQDRIGPYQVQELTMSGRSEDLYCVQYMCSEMKIHVSRKIRS